MASWDQQQPGGKKSEYLGNHTYTTEAGHVVEFDNTPGDCRIHIYHKSGTFVEIKDDGAMITTSKGRRQDFNDKGQDAFVTGEFNLTVNGPINIYCTGNVVQHIDGNYELNVGGDYKLKVGGNQLTEVIGDERKQVNGKASHRTSSDRDEITGGNKTETINREYYQSVGTEATVISGGSYAVLAGDDFQAIATDQVGIGAGSICAIAAGSQVQIKAKDSGGANDGAVFVEGSDCVQINGLGGPHPSFIFAKGDGRAGLCSDNQDVVLGAGKKVKTRTDEGTKLEATAVVPPSGKVVPGSGAGLSAA